MLAVNILYFLYDLKFYLHNQRNRLSIVTRLMNIYFFFYRKMKFVLHTTYDNDESIFDILHIYLYTPSKSEILLVTFHFQSHYLRRSVRGEKN